MARASNVMIGTLTLALTAGSLGAFLGYQKFAANKQKTPFRVIFEGAASGLRVAGCGWPHGLTGLARRATRLTVRRADCHSGRGA